MQLYVNGVYNGSNNIGSTLTLTNALNLFRYGSGGYISHSKLAALLVWNRVLSAAEIEGHVAAPWRMFQPPRAYFYGSDVIGDFVVSPSSI